VAAAFRPRIIEGRKELKRGEILIPELLAKGMKVKVGDAVGHRGTTRTASVNGQAVHGRRESSRA